MPLIRWCSSRLLLEATGFGFGVSEVWDAGVQGFPPRVSLRRADERAPRLSNLQACTQIADGGTLNLLALHVLSTSESFP